MGTHPFTKRAARRCALWLCLSAGICGAAQADALDLALGAAGAPAHGAVQLDLHIVENPAGAASVLLTLAFDEALLAADGVLPAPALTAAGAELAFNPLPPETPGGPARLRLTLFGTGTLPVGRVAGVVLRIAPDAELDSELPVTLLDGDAATPSGEPVTAAMAPGAVTVIAPPRAPHSADTNGNWRIELGEILRVVQFFNLDGYHCQQGTEDGFAPGEGPRECARHDADYLEPAWRVSLSEVLRVVQLLNVNNGNYRADAEGEDGFAPGPFGG